MRSWIIGVVLAGLVAASVVYAVPVEDSDSGSRTIDALRSWLHPVTSYFSRLPAKSPSDVATDVKEKVTDVKEWAQDNQAIQGLVSSLVPVKNWLQEKANTLKDQSFSDMYEDVKQRVANLDERVGAWIQEHNTK